MRPLPITTPAGFIQHTAVPLPFLEHGEIYQYPEPTDRNITVSRTINALREELSPLRAELMPHLAVKVTVIDISDLINCGLCHVFATLVKGFLTEVGIELTFVGDPFHIWLYDPVESVHYDAFFTLGTRYRADLDGGYCDDPDVGQGWGLERLCAEYTDYESKLHDVRTLLRTRNPMSAFLIGV